MEFHYFVFIATPVETKKSDKFSRRITIIYPDLDNDNMYLNNLIKYNRQIKFNQD